MARETWMEPSDKASGHVAAKSRGRGALARLRGDERGGVALMAAITATSLFGVAGLAVEVGGWYALRRNMQAAADAAAIAGALNYDGARSASGAAAAAQSVASRNGFVDGQGGTQATVSTDAATGRITVAIQRPATAGLLRAAGFAASTRLVSARGVAVVVDAGAPPCVLAMSGGLLVGNNTDITAPGCALASNSAAADAFHVGSGGSTGNGSGKITAANIVTHGGCEGCAESMGDRLTLTRSVVASSYAPKSKNAYAALDAWTPPAAATSNANCVPALSEGALAPGCYNGISNQPGRTINLAPGIYYLRGGDLDIKGRLTCTSCTPTQGVSIVLVAAGGNAAPGKVSVGSQGAVVINASRQLSEPDLDGVAIYRHHPNGTPGNNAEIDFGAGATVDINGAVVAPTSAMSMGGNAAAGPTSCNMFVVASAEFKGGTSLGAAGCDLYGTKTSTPRMARLVQ